MLRLASIGIALAAAAVAASAPALGASRAGWPPSRGSAAAHVAAQIAAHVAPRYRVDEGGARLVGITASRPQLESGDRMLPVLVLAVRRSPYSEVGLALHATTATQAYKLCGTGRRCSIGSGRPTALRGRVVRREALELALDTFTYSPTITSVLVFLPPAPGSTLDMLAYFRRADLAAQLARPRAKTLPLDTPPLPTDPNKLEARTIDRLTLPRIYDWDALDLRGGGGALILDPAA